MSLSFLLPFLRQNSGRPALLCLWLFFAGLVSPLYAQNTTSPPLKARNAAPPFYATKMALEASASNAIRTQTNQPALKEIDAEASIALRVVGTGADAVIRPFWLGQADLRAIAQKRWPNGERRDVYDPQKYLWTVDLAPSIPVAAAQPEISPSLMLADMGAAVLPNGLAYKLAWDDLPPWAKTTVKFMGQEVLGLEETAVDGRSLAELKTTVSRPTKHFYWDFGPSIEAFPQTTTTQVVFTSEAAPDALGPAVARINWQIPTRTIYEVEVELWNWVDSQEADPATLEEWQHRILNDEELQKEIATDVAIEVVGLAAPGAGRMIGRGGKVVFRIVLKSKAPAHVVTGITERAMLRSTTRPALRPDGTTLPTPAWHRTHSLHTTVKDAVRRGDPLINHVVSEAAEDIASDFAEQNDPTKPNGADKAPEGERDDKSKRDINPKPLYFYTQNPSGFINTGADRWPNLNTNPLWTAGYYLTDLTPTEATRLRSGQHSFALYGHPYVWGSGSGVSWVAVHLSQAQWNRLGRRAIHDASVLGGALRDRQVYQVAANEDVALAGLGSRAPDDQTPNGPPLQGGLTFQSGTPGAEDLPFGSDLPIEGNKGTWNGGQRGNSIWTSTDSEVLRDVYNNRLNSFQVPYNNGYPSFSTWLYGLPNVANGSVYLPPITGRIIVTGDNTRDFGDADSVLAERLNLLNNGQPSAAQAKAWRQSRKPALTWHHYEDMKTMQLVPSILNLRISHQGSASHARSARW